MCTTGREQYTHKVQCQRSKGYYDIILYSTAPYISKGHKKMVIQQGNTCTRHQHPLAQHPLVQHSEPRHYVFIDVHKFPGNTSQTTIERHDVSV